MPRFIDFDRSEREIPYGDLADADDATLVDRVDLARRLHRPAGPDTTQATVDRIEAIVRRFRDKRAASGSVVWTNGRIRPERRWVRIYLQRKEQRIPPRVLAEMYDVPTSYVYSAIKKGRRLLLEAAGRGKFADLILTARPE